MSSNIMKYNVYERASVGGNLDTFNDISKVVIPSSGYMKSPGGNGCHTTSTLESTLVIHKESSKVSKQTHIVEELNESGDVEYHCTACRKRFRSRTQKYYHLDCPHLDERAFECDICKKSFARQSQLKYHRESHTASINQCITCQKTFSNPLALKKHESLHKVQPKPCTHCDKTFLKKTSLEEHIAAQHLQQLHYGCVHCSKRYASKSTLQLHLQSHEKKRFECSFCGRFYQRKSILNLHLNRHSQISPSYKCQTCDKVFGESGALSRHRKIHEESSVKYHCVLCNKNILRKDNMTRHMMTIHPDEKYEDVVNILKPLLPQTNEQIQGVIKKTEKVMDEVNTDKDQTVNTGESNTIVANETSVDAQSSAHFIILENKLIQKPLQSPLDKELNGPQVYRKDGGKSLVQNQIQVITVLSTNYETGADHVNLIEVPFSDKVENGNEGTFNRVPHISHNWNDLKQQPVLENQIDLNSKLTPLGRSNEQQQPSDYNECKNTDIPRNTPSVIRSIGNVNKKLTAPQANDDPNEKANTTLEYDYKHKKYNHHYNVDLYRKILGCDDDSCHSEGHHREQVHHEASFETAIPTAVHWRKCFKNIYETSAT